MWPYKDISQIDFLKRLRFVEKVIEKLGAVCVGESEEKVSHISKNTILPENELVPEMKYALGILPYPEWEKQL